MDFQNFIREVKERIDLPTVVGRYMALKKSGSRYVGLCPFHNDHSPSMYVTPQLGIYKCFVCGASGDVIKFVMESEKSTFIEALEMLAKEIGLELPSTGDAKDHSHTQELVDVLQAASQYFQKSLKTNNMCRDYLQSRGLTDETIRQFGIGYAPETTELFDYLKSQGHHDKIMELAGLKRGERFGVGANIFAGRLMFPILSVSGRVVGFGGRTLNKDLKPKYLNSPESALYKKSQLLYGLHLSRSAMARENEGILVEGYMDVCSLWQAGFKNVCAVSGTALTASQAGQLRRFCERVHLCLDGDKPGRAAIMRTLPELLKAGIEVRIPILSGTEDPDSIIQSSGMDAFKQRLAKSENLPQFLRRHLGDNWETLSPEQKEAVWKEGTTVLDNITSQFVAESYGKEWHVLLDRPYEKRPSQTTSANKSTGRNNMPTHPNNNTQMGMLPVGRDPSWQLIRLLIYSKTLAQSAIDRVQLDWLDHQEAREILDHLFAFVEETGSFEVGEWLPTLPSEPRARVETLVSRDFFASTRENIEFEDILVALERNYLKRQMKLLSQKVGQGLLSAAEGLQQQKEFQTRLKQLSGPINS